MEDMKYKQEYEFEIMSLTFKSQNALELLQRSFQAFTNSAKKNDITHLRRYFTFWKSLSHSSISQETHLVQDSLHQISNALCSIFKIVHNRLQQQNYVTFFDLLSYSSDDYSQEKFIKELNKTRATQLYELLELKDELKRLQVRKQELMAIMIEVKSKEKLYIKHIDVLTAYHHHLKTASNKIHYQSALLNEQIQPKIRKLLRVNSKLRESLKLREDHVTQFIKEMNCLIAKKEHERVKYSPRGQETNRRMF